MLRNMDLPYGESDRVITFWKAHRAYWLPITDTAKAEADAVIRDTFWCFDRAAENLVGQIIYLDQFSRHFQRVGLLQEEDVRHYREEAATLVRQRQRELCHMDEVEITFALMPFKHLGEYDAIFRAVHKLWLPAQGASKTLLDFPTLQRFYMDTYKKAYTLDRLRAGIARAAASDNGASSLSPPDDPEDICDVYPEAYRAAYTEDEDPWADHAETAGATHPLQAHLTPYTAGKGVVSLSGGVDSIVMLALLAAAGVEVMALHIIYGNRPECNEEARLLVEYCKRLGVKIALYRIPWLRRGEIDRDFYEDMTRQLRFWAYRAAAEVGKGDAETADTPVFLGHIQDDVVENIWTNIASGTHLGDLKKMQAEEVQMGVRLVRPFLGVQKRDIYAAAKLLAVPYLKNTTPSWSNRGKFREHFHAATVAQFGAGVDARLIAFAEAMQRQTALVQRFVYEPVYASWSRESEGTVNITTAVEAGLDAAGWTEIFTYLCHTRLDCCKPSVKAVREFCRRMERSGDRMRVNMSGEFHVRVWRDAAAAWWMKFIATGS